MTNMSGKSFNATRAALLLACWLIGVGFAAVSIAEDAPPPGDLNRGVTAWSENCNRCHRMRDPKEFRDDQWKVIVTHMRVRAGLTGQDTRDILKFLQSSN